jgi:hypothetical protein
LVSRAKVICQVQKDFSKRVKNIRHDLIHNEYPQEIVDSIIKPSRNNHPSSETIYQGTVIIPYAKGTSEKFRSTGNCSNAKVIFETKHKLRGALTKTGLVRDAQQTKQQSM